mgnify:CR=1 FL=1
MKTKFVLLASLFVVSVGFSQKKWTLKECVDHALENNITVKQNELNVQLADLEVKRTKGNFLPDLSASTGGNLSFGSTFDPVSQNRVSNTLFGGSLGVNSRINIFNGFRFQHSCVVGLARISIDHEIVDVAALI